MKAFSLKYWRKVLAKEWLPIVISLVLAIITWYNVGGEQTVDTNVMIPVEVINLPRDLVISNQFKKQIEVTVNGPRSLIRDIESKNISRQIDLSKATPGTTVISNDVDSIEVPRGITVLRVQPSTIILSLDKLIQKTIPINPVTAGTLRPGYVMKGLKMDPEVITVTGPETVLSRHQVFRTKIIDINNLDKSTQIQIPLDLEPAIVDLIGETTITADITVGLEVEQKKYTLELEEPVGEGDRRVDKVQVIANVPTLLLDQDVNVPDFLTARVEKDAEGRIGTVRIEQSRALQYPVEIIQIDPSLIRLVQPPEPPETSETQPAPPADTKNEQESP